MDYLFTTNIFNFKSPRSVRLVEIQLFCFGDVHRDTTSCDVDRWHEFIRYTQQFDQDYCLYLYMGDAVDFASASEKQKLLSAGLHETTLDKFDRIAMKDVGLFCNEIKHMKGHMIGCISGNHSWKFSDGKTSDEVIAEQMGCRSLGWLSFNRVVIYVGNSRTKLDIMSCHGKAGGKLLGTTINQVEDMKRICPACDVYVMGHDHKLAAIPDVYLEFQTQGGKIVIKQHEQRLCRSGSFKKSYTSGESSYEVGRLYRPSILGALHLTVRIHKIHVPKQHDKGIFTKQIISHV
jgi:hypothetical protein